MYIAYFLFIMVDNVLEIKKLKGFFPKYLSVIVPQTTPTAQTITHNNIFITTTYISLVCLGFQRHCLWIRR